MLSLDHEFLASRFSDRSLHIVRAKTSRGPWSVHYTEISPTAASPTILSEPARLRLRSKGILVGIWETPIQCSCTPFPIMNLLLCFWDQPSPHLLGPITRFLSGFWPKCPRLSKFLKYIFKKVCLLLCKPSDNPVVNSSWPVKRITTVLHHHPWREQEKGAGSLSLGKYHRHY